jgi:hypothetical protein
VIFLIFFAPYFFRRDTFHHQYQIPPQKMITAAFPIENRKRKTPLFQSFMVKNQATALSMKQLDGCSRAIYEDKNAIAERINGILKIEWIYGCKPALWQGTVAFVGRIIDLYNN